MFTDPVSGERSLLVRTMRHEDLKQVWSWRNEWRVRRYMFSQDEIEWEAHQLWFERATQDPLKHLLIVEIDGLSAGFVSFSESGSGRIADWSFHTATDSPKGYGRLLCSAALNYGFHSLNLHKVCGRVLGNNEGSLRLHRLLGFTLEGVMRDGYHDGHNYFEVYCFGIFNYSNP